MQPGNTAGTVELQAEGEWARAVSVNAAGTYPHGTRLPPHAGDGGSGRRPQLPRGLF